jgi:hypothetical protein
LTEISFWTIKDVLRQFLVWRKKMEETAKNLEMWVYGKGQQQIVNYTVSPAFTTPPVSPKLPKRRIVV